MARCAVVKKLFFFWLRVGLLFYAGVANFSLKFAVASGGQFVLTVIDRTTQQPIPCRMHLKNSQQRPVRADKAPFFFDHFVFDSSTTLKLPKGHYTFEIEHGLEYLNRTGTFQIDDFADDAQTVDLFRFCDMSKEGWWAGDLLANRPENDMPLLMSAEDIHVVCAANGKSPGGRATSIAKNKGDKGTSAPSGTIWNIGANRWLGRYGGSENRPGGQIGFLNLETPWQPLTGKGESPHLASVITATREHGKAWIDAQHPASYDLPLWLAHNLVDSIDVAGGYLQKNAVKEDAPGLRPRDTLLFPGPEGAGRSNLDIYFRLLECGLRIPPTASSGSGEANNPLGYNRVYVHLDGDPTWNAWWKGLRAGQVLVTNGPLIRPQVEGFAPGHVFRVDAGQSAEFEIGLTLSTREKIDYLEIVRDGRVVYNARLDQWEKEGHHLPLQKFTKSGWFLVRAVTNHPKSYHFGMTAPYFVEVGYEKRISKESAEYFQSWLTQRRAQIDKADFKDKEKVLPLYDQAAEYWTKLVLSATVD
jgi:hypothetical protein